MVIENLTKCCTGKTTRCRSHFSSEQGVGISQALKDQLNAAKMDLVGISRQLVRDQKIKLSVADNIEEWQEL